MYSFCNYEFKEGKLNGHAMKNRNEYILWNWMDVEILTVGEKEKQNKKLLRAFIHSMKALEESFFNGFLKQ